MSETKNYTLLNLEQPIGNFGLAIMPVEDVIKISYINRRQDNTTSGIQRKLIPDRVRKIAIFIDEHTEKIAFPTPIILSLTDNSYEDPGLNKYTIEGNVTNDSLSTLKITDFSSPFAEVIDGQHRLAGIQSSKTFNSGNLKLNLPVLFVRDATDAVGAYLFSTINGNQRPVPYSLIADLFALQPDRSITKIAHNIVSDLNTLPQSPLKDSIKMLGFRTSQLETISQGTIVKELEKLMTKNQNFKNIYLKKDEAIFSKVLINMFNAIRNTWGEDWYETTSVIKKTVGFHGFMTAFPLLYEEGLKQKTLKQDYFEKIFLKSKANMDLNTELKINNNIYFTSENFPSNLQGAKKLTNLILLKN